MPHISPNEIPQQKLHQLYNYLIDTFSRADKDGRSYEFFTEFFTHTEKIMLSKRLAIIYLLSRKFSEETIASKLKMSRATVSRFSSKMDSNKYKNILEVTEESGRWIKGIEKLLQAGLPPIAGRGRYRRTDRGKYGNKKLDI